jgi:hypothetical protein
MDIAPPGIYPDEAINANQAITEPGKIFYQENNGREGLYINMIAASFSVFGISIWSFKIISALAGILSVLGLYLLTNLLFSDYGKNRARYTALFSSFFMAVSFWHINFSRIGFRAILVPLILIFSFYFLFKGIKTQKLWNFIVAGAIFGIGFHTYISFRVAVLLLGIILLLWLFSFRKHNLQKKFLIFASVFLIFVFITALPIGIYFLENPGDFMGRATGVSVFAQPNPVKALGVSFVAHMAMFNFFGDYNSRHNVPGSPILFWPVGLLFLIGFILSCVKLRDSMNPEEEYIFTLARKSKRATSLGLPSLHLKISGKKYNSFSLYFFLISWLFIMLLPGILSYEGIPHSLRCIGALPVVFIFTGIGACFLYKRIRRLCEKRGAPVIASEPTGERGNLIRKALPCLLILLCISFIFVQFNKYFITWGQNPETYNAFSYNCVAIGNYLNSLPDDAEKYVVINESGPNLPLPVETIKFIQHTQGKEQFTNYIFQDQIKDIKITDKPIYIVLMDKNEKLLSEIQTHFPEHEIIKYNDIWGVYYDR